MEIAGEKWYIKKSTGWPKNLSPVSDNFSEDLVQNVRILVPRINSVKFMLK